MRAYRDNISKVVSLLTYMLKALDPDGLDVCFTQSSQKVHAGNSTTITTAVRQVPYQGYSNMRTRLSHILQEHKHRFGTSSPPSGPWYKRAGPPKSPRPLSFYVLTDGNWQPRNEVGPTITSLVEGMRKHRLPKEHVGIQFIRFGDDPNGIDRLNYLDHGLGLGDMDM